MTTFPQHRHPLALGESLFVVGFPPPSAGLISLFVEGLLFF